MDIVEFAEKFLGAKMCDWQKDHLRTLDSMKLRGNIRVVMRLPNEFYIYMDRNSKKELIQHGQTSNSYH